MRKIYLLFLTVVCLCNTVLAEEGTLMIKGPEGYQVMAVSPNGKWACGVYYGSNLGFVWDLENNVITNLDKGGQSFANDVSDNGIVCGRFYADKINENGLPGVAGGYWQNGVYTTLKDENGVPIANCNAQAISADGQYIAGVIVETNGRYQPAIWKNGILETRLDTKNQHGGVSGMSNDASIVFGWYNYDPHIQGTPPNRQPCYWDTELHPLGITESDRGGFLNTHAISPNNRYIAAHVGNYDQQSDYSMQEVVYDIVKKDTIYISIPFLEATDPDGALSCNDVWDDGSAIMRLQSEKVTEGLYDDYIYHTDGTYQKVTDYIKEEYKSSLPSGFYHVGWGYFSADKKTYVGLCMKYSSSSESGQIYYPVVWKAGKEIDTPSPVALTTEILPSTVCVLLKWKEPLNNADKVTGYRIYVNNKVATEVPADQLEYVYTNERNEAELKCEVAALYDAEKVESTERVEATVKLQDARYADPPANFVAYHANYNDVILKWGASITGYDVSLRHYKNENAVPFGSSEPKTFMAGIDFNKQIIGCYSDYYELTAVEFFFGDPVEDMDLYIYSNGKQIWTQKIDQSKLVSGRRNAVRLTEPLTLPKDGDIKIAIRVNITSGAAPLELAEGPSIDGGDLLSLDDGQNWITVRELTGGLYNYNWMIGMLLESNGRQPGGFDPAPPVSRSPMSAPVYQYIVYRDGEEIGRVDAENTTDENFEFVDENVAQGYHDYGVSTLYFSSKISTPITKQVYVAKKELVRCAAPINIKANIDTEKKEMALSWDLPERSEVSYTNWTYGAGMYISGKSGWMQAIRLTAEKLRPFIGYKITNVKFYPRADADFTVHVFEDGAPVSSQDVTKYTLNMVNAVKLDTPVDIKWGSGYLIIVEMTDGPIGTPILGTDNSYPSNEGRLYSEDGEGFTIDQQSKGGNWMIGVDVDRMDGGFIPDVTYKVYMNDALLEDNINEKTYTTSIADRSEKSAKINVSAIYSIGERRSEDVTVNLDPSSIDVNESASVKIYPNPASSYIKIEGEVENVSITDVSGQIVYQIENENIIDVTHFIPGMYLLKSVIDGKIYINKIQIVK
ncbi:T9SS type A sorting domain-containing protein [Bacteroides sp. OM05-12]|jgi:hypothetical protein|uniref:T9SS type A sorting domain-containing protein n=1 Tax=Bacteroides sp. OM05-12 TaxID=2292283 RepID=UPI000E825080|nr:T9SS type A sorting domain-containing protein [Bacteroides sp. OM05-12]RGN51206.1 T9SS C-terminal target domain-containing protein [Bacteroides sp. OM05-12]